MPAFTSRPFRGAPDIPELVALARANLSRRWPALPYLHPGDVVWQLTGRPAGEDTTLWYDEQGLAAYADFQAPCEFVVELRHDVEPGEAHLAAVLAWAETRRRLVPADAALPVAYQAIGAGALATQAFDSDVPRVDALRQAGFAKVDLFGFRMRRPLADLSGLPGTPAGVILRHAAEADIAERVDLHRDAWSVWGPSGFSEAQYRALRASPEYREELDVVVESGGRLVSYCVCWADAASGVGIFEPVGTRPAVAGRGFGRLAIFEGLRRLKAMGMHTALIGTSSVNAPAERLYRACGFEHVDRQYFYARSVV